MRHDHGLFRDLMNIVAAGGGVNADIPDDPFPEPASFSDLTKNWTGKRVKASKEGEHGSAVSHPGG